MPTPINAFGTFLKRGDGGSPETFTTIAEVGTISGPKLGATIQDVTTHSTGQPWREKQATLLDGGAVSFPLYFIPTDPTHSFAAGLLADFAGRVKRNFKMVFPDQPNTTWSFTAYVTAFSCTEDVAKVMEAAVTLEITGQPTLA